MEKYTLTKEVKEDLFAIKRKIEIEVNPAFFTKEDRAVMSAAYNQLTGKNPCWNCSGFMSKVRLSLNNYFKWHDHNEMEKVTIEDRELKPVVKEVMKEIIEDFEPPTFIKYESEDLEHLLNLDALTLSELRELYPDIKSNSKSKFIQKIIEDGK